MPARAKLEGLVFGRLTVEACNGSNHLGKLTWLCRCTCGKTTVTTTGNLNSGITKSCGCFQKDTVAALKYKHGKGSTRTNVDSLYRTWLGMRDRCSNPRNSNWHLYGGRGIKVCERWNDFHLFELDMGEKPTPQHSIDRVDGSKGYSPDNCRWATVKEQHDNRRPHAKQMSIVIEGVMYPSLRKASLATNISRQTLSKLTSTFDASVSS